MNKMIIAAAVAGAGLLAIWHPAPAPPIAAATAGAGSQAPMPRSRRGRRRAFTSASPGAEVVVYVAGAVEHPGLYRLRGGARAADAVRRAGGLLPQADPVAVNLAERLSDGEEIAVLRTGEAPRARTRRAAGSSRRRKSAATVPSAPLDLNAADETALASLPGVGDTLAARIVEYRRVNGPFASVDELADVAGMSQRRVDALAPYLVAGGN